jgi:uncharacterized OsmC-like protein
MSDEHTYHVTVRHAREYEFVAEFNDLVRAPSMLFDEPEPLGKAQGPNAASVVGAAVGNCLSASLLLCLKKARVDVDGLSARVTTHVARNEKGRLRITGIDVVLEPTVPAADAGRLARCEELFEEFCTVTASVRQGIPVNVSVEEPSKELTTFSAA